MRQIQILIITFLLSSCGVPELKSDEELVLGVWIINHTNSVIDYSIIEYQNNNDKCEIAFSLINHLEVDMYWNKWRIEDGIIYSTIHNTNTLLEYGTKIGDKITTLNNDQLIVDMVIPEGDYSTEYHFKNHSGKKGQVCNTVRKYFQNKSKQELSLHQG